jgi:hypothetical protein
MTRHRPAVRLGGPRERRTTKPKLRQLAARVGVLAA